MAAGASLASGCAAPDCTFTNPVAIGADPWVVRHEGVYYRIEARDRALTVYKLDRLTEPGQRAVRVWTAPDTGWNHDNVWAPELHRLDGKWLIYYSAGPHKGPPFDAQRVGVLESVSDDPQGAYVDRGQLYTGDDIGAGIGGSGAIGDGNDGRGSVWAIDFTVARIDGVLYGFWSGWARNASPGPLTQHLYAARMASPVAMATSRVRIASPTARWETGGPLDLEEGPTVLSHDADTFIVYSTRESWLPAYRLGWLRRRAPGADPLDPASWIKSDGPAFSGAADALGAGHASFTTSPDGTEDWIVYHAKSAERPGWKDRSVRMQRFGWKSDGSPAFGVPVPGGQPIAQPAGQCR